VGGAGAGDIAVWCCGICALARGVGVAAPESVCGSVEAWVSGVGSITFVRFGSGELGREGGSCVGAGVVSIFAVLMWWWIMDYGWGGGEEECLVRRVVGKQRRVEGLGVGGASTIRLRISSSCIQLQIDSAQTFVRYIHRRLSQLNSLAIVSKWI
jgi:hypothetical protein